MRRGLKCSCKGLTGEESSKVNVVTAEALEHLPPAAEGDGFETAGCAQPLHFDRLIVNSLPSAGHQQANTEGHLGRCNRGPDLNLVVANFGRVVGEGSDAVERVETTPCRIDSPVGARAHVWRVARELESNVLRGVVLSRGQPEPIGKSLGQSA